MAEGKKSSCSLTLMPPGVKESKQSAERLQALMEEAPIGICHTDLTGKFTYVNKRFEKVTGYSREEVVGKNGFKLRMFSLQTLKLFRERMKSKLMGRPTGRIETQFKCKDGHGIWVAIEAQLIRERGIPVGFQIVSSDITERKKAEEELKSSGERLKILFEFAPDAYYLNDLKGNFVDGNKAAEEITGYKKEELIGKTFLKLKLLSPEQIPKAAVLLAKNVLGQSTGPDKFILNRKDDSQVPVEIRTFPVTIEGKTLVLGIARDITERKRAEEALLESEERFRSIVENSLDGIMILDDAYRLTYVNDELCRISGYSREETIGQDFRKFLDEESKQLVAERYIRRQKGEEIPPRYEFNIVRKDGQKRRVEISSSVIKDSAGRVKTVAQILDITERKRAEEQLLRLSNAVKMSTDSIVIADLEAKIIDVNEATLKMYGTDDEKDLIGKNSLELIVPEEREKALEGLREALEKGYVTRREYHIVIKDGSKVLVEMNSAVMKDADGKPIGFVAVSRDIAERKQMEQKLRDAQEQLHRSEKLAAIGQLAGGVGHELRNPLGAIKNAVFYVRRRIAKSDLPATEPKVMEFLDTIDKEVNSANKVITDLLGFSRVAKPTVSSVNIGGIIEGALEHVPMPGNVELTRDIDPSLPMVMVDGGQIQQVFANIILNAVEAMTEGGRLEIMARSKDDFVKVRFTDSGCGIPESIISKIFDPLFTTKAKGIGLGLAMCKSIVERHGGDIQLKSEEGKGTTFTVSLPTTAV
jgi:two-component system sporulation sensor kinase A